MKINLKARLKNKAFLVSASALIISFVYHILARIFLTPLEMDIGCLLDSLGHLHYTET